MKMVKIFGFVAGIFIIMFVGFFCLGIFLSVSKDYEKSANVLPLMQDYLTEAAAAKIMGDSIMIDKPTPNASFTKVKTSAQTAAENLAALSVPNTLKDYKKTAVDWANEIVVAAKNTKIWKDLPSQPADFQLALNNGKAEDWFKTSLQKIHLLKEFGDSAIKNKDRETMRYIAAKLAIQQHWLNGIIHSEKAGFLSFDLISVVLGKGEFKYGPGIRNVCLDITGVAGAYCAQAAAISTWEITASAIGFVEQQPGAEEAWNGAWHNAEAMGKIFESEPAIGVTEHSPTVQAFYGGCKAKGGLVGGSGMAMARMPTTQGGYKCEYKTDSPHFGKGILCWDVLTYSGGRYMGGNSGCPEYGLIPSAVIPEAAPAPATSAPTKKTTPAPAQKSTPSPSASESTTAAANNKWDGNYSASCIMECNDYRYIFCPGCEGADTTKPPISQKFDFNIKVQNNAVVSGTGEGHISGDGYASNRRIMFPNNNEAFLSYQFSLSGSKATVAGGITGSYDVYDCSCDFSGVRNSN